MGLVEFNHQVLNRTGLVSLDISGNNICSDGATAIASCLCENTTLATLKLGDNSCAAGMPEGGGRDHGWAANSAIEEE